MVAITPRWLLKLLPWVQVPGGTYRVNRREFTNEPTEEHNDKGERNIAVTSGYSGEVDVTGTAAHLQETPREYPLDIVQTVVHLHTRVSDLYSYPIDQLREQLRLTIEAMKERQELDAINSPDYGLLNSVDDSMKVRTRSGAPTPDDMDELLSRMWKKPAFFLAHPKAIAAFGRECTRRGVPPAIANVFGSPVLTWRGVPLIPTNKLMANGEGRSKKATGTTSILLMRVGEAEQGVIGLHRTGLPGEVSPGVTVRLMGIDQQAIASYLVTLYHSVVVPVPDALAALQNVEVSHYHDYK
jgi:hypothetical protein